MIMLEVAMKRKFLGRKIALICLSLIAMFFSVSHHAEAVVFGEPDGEAHPQVGVLLFVQNGIGFFSCTGTLLSPTVMLTAGHCVEGSNNQTNDVTYVRFTENALEGIEGYTDLQKWLDEKWIRAEEVIPHPEYDNYNDFPNTFDVGLVRLPSSQAVYPTVYGILPTEGFLETVKKDKNKENRFTVVGYGLQGLINPFYQDDFARYQAATRLVELNSYFNGPGSSAKFTSNPGHVRGGTCFGDSGGPIFYQDTPIITAIVSFGMTPCIGVSYQYRIDTDTALNFITPYLMPESSR